jgi:RNA polymerase sigma factor (sigma-70 family)
MSAKQLQGVIQHLRRTAGARGLRGVPDGELLKRFRADRDEAAFELIVWRHGKMVFNVCRRICRNGPDADDAFQAAFLALVRKAGTIRQQESLGGWLYKVAYRAARLARGRITRRTGRIQTADLESIPGSVDTASSAAWREVRLLIDDELHRLPEKYRLPFVLCHLEGHSNADAARLLGCAVGTVESRLTRARQRLRSALARRGVALTTGLTLTPLGCHAASACVPGELILVTAKAALMDAGGHVAPGLISAKVAVLTEGVLKTMFVSQMKTVASLLLAVGLLAGAAGGWTYHALPATARAEDDDSSKLTTKGSDADRIAKLIEQLGSDTFADREAASRGLERQGAAALEGLRKAAQSNDPETRRRAEALVKKIEKDLASSELLKAKHVHLRCKDTPLPEAVADLAKQSGYDIALDDSDGKLKERKVTLDTGDVPFWRAVDLLCKAGGVVEVEADGPMGLPMFPGGPARIVAPAAAVGAVPAMPLLPPAVAPAAPGPGGGALPGAGATPAAPAPGEKPAKEAPTSPAAAPPGGQTKLPPAAAPPAGKSAPAGKAPPAVAPPGGNNAKPPAPPAGGVAVKRLIPAAPGAGFALKAPGVLQVTASIGTNRLVLKDGKAASSPTAYVGAARVRALSDAKRGPAPAGDGEVNVGLQISLEPRLLWRNLTAMRLDKALDDQDQTLEEAAAPKGMPAPGFAGLGGPGGGLAMPFLPDQGLGLHSGANLYTLLRLKKGEKPAKTLKQLKGTLTAEVFGPIKPFLTVENLLKAAGKTLTGKDGGSLEVLEVARGDGDEITVKLALDPPSDMATGGTVTAGVVAVAAVPALPAPGGALPPPAPPAKVPPPPAPAAGAVALGVPVNNQDVEISLVDAKGKPVEMTNHTVSYRGGDKGFTHMHEFTLRLPKDQDTVKLIFSGRRLATIDVPFTLTDVPLP